MLSSLDIFWGNPVFSINLSINLSINGWPRSGRREHAKD